MILGTAPHEFSGNGNGRHADGAGTGGAAGAGDGGFVVELQGFSGPLDLLLSLLRDEQIDIYDIPIAHIAAQFLSRLRNMGLDQAADYLEMAARLLRIKAQMLLPRSDGEEGWEDPRAELVRRLLEYQQMREVVDVLERHGEERRNRFARAYLPEYAPPPAGPLSLSLHDLLAAVDRVLRVAREPTLHDVVPRAIDVDGAIDAIRRVLEAHGQTRWWDILPRQAEPWEILSLLLALLELARRGELRMEQERPFDNVEISREQPVEAA